MANDLWDSTNNGNGFTFKGSLDPNQYNIIYGFTLGKIDFISQTARSLSDLVGTVQFRSKQIDPKSKKVKNLLTVSVPPNGDIMRWLELQKNPNNTLDKKLGLTQLNSYLIKIKNESTESN